MSQGVTVSHLTVVKLLNSVFEHFHRRTAKKVSKFQ